ncbi:Hypothetical protein NCDO2118_p0011 (plasmid) [Lactococcus lactis subsp. lactis NCDO 2118]|uniref:Uncharacterized protein n=1 Tax=Lactococcus lactis subsp. lactis NCDO 2118 TaxID=1117941 RepID=A0ABC8A935_LACLL|nr:Hypothetical protein NCDO2118_p0011 [Lactococcus lactis subsp. lactis NCDO 2118]
MFLQLVKYIGEQYIIDTLTYYSFYTKILELGNFATEQILLC